MLIAVFLVYYFNANRTNNDFSTIIPDYLIVSNDDSKLFFTIIGKDNKFKYLIQYDVKSDVAKTLYKTDGLITGLSLSKDSSKILFSEMNVKSSTSTIIIYDVINYRILNTLEFEDRYYSIASFYPDSSDNILLINKEQKKYGSCYYYNYSVMKDDYQEIDKIDCAGKMPIDSSFGCFLSTDKLNYIQMYPNNKNEFKQYNLKTKEEVTLKEIKRSSKDELSQLTCSGNSALVYKSMSKNENMMLFEEDNMLKEIQNKWDNLLSLDMSPDKEMLSASLLSGDIEIFNIENNKVIKRIRNVYGAITEWNADSNVLYILARAQSILKYDLDKDKLTKLCSISEFKINSHMPERNHNNNRQKGKGEIP